MERSKGAEFNEVTVVIVGEVSECAAVGAVFSNGSGVYCSCESGGALGSRFLGVVEGAANGDRGEVRWNRVSLLKTRN